MGYYEFDKGDKVKVIQLTEGCTAAIKVGMIGEIVNGFEFGDYPYAVYFEDINETENMAAEEITNKIEIQRKIE